MIVTLKESSYPHYEHLPLDEMTDPMLVVARYDCILDVIGLEGDRFSALRRDTEDALRDKRRQWRLEAKYP